MGSCNAAALRQNVIRLRAAKREHILRDRVERHYLTVTEAPSTKLREIPRGSLGRSNLVERPHSDQHTSQSPGHLAMAQPLPASSAFRRPLLPTRWRWEMHREQWRARGEGASTFRSKRPQGKRCIVWPLLPEPRSASTQWGAFECQSESINGRTNGAAKRAFPIEQSASRESPNVPIPCPLSLRFLRSFQIFGALGSSSASLSG